MKKILLFCAFLSASFVLGQKIRYKKDKVLVDDKEILKTEKIGSFGAGGFNLYELDGKKPIIALIAIDNGTHMDLSDDYIQVKFLTKGTKAEIAGGDLQSTIKLLMQNDIIDSKGIFDESKVDLFVQNFDDKISERTVLHR
ncbi:hypothetical protein [Chryseobacterium bernardetii]|uniref:Uncharacterized protein n=1 Tax=Chryseobacterium bernardetii TaxID=1241978 RepID=A0A3G6TC38_9FLAO|nr:hypothetical protein [Chryseobacterium bernardetii]AZB24226.1 hypothetical protein EG339_06195 [Chryseobacterium bernardetii]AZB34832.1 hypothetical protein EG351_15240 [Chryseobacterium bernardetii]